MRGSSANAQSQRGSVGIGGGIRVVLLERDPDVRRKMQQLIDELPSLVVAGSADSWPRCEALLGEYVPELLIAGSNQLPDGVVFSPSGFPLTLRLGASCRECQLAQGGADCPHLRRALTELTHEIYLRKASELSLLLDLYFTGIGRPAYVSTLKVYQSGEPLELPVERIDMIVASGNYVRIYASPDTYEVRETISGISARLDPAEFARVHRSYIVNLIQVTHVLQPESMASHVTLKGGQTVPIGPNYRLEILRTLESRLKLIA